MTARGPKKRCRQGSCKHTTTAHDCSKLAKHVSCRTHSYSEHASCRIPKTAGNHRTTVRSECTLQEQHAAGIPAPCRTVAAHGYTPVGRTFMQTFLRLTCAVALVASIVVCVQWAWRCCCWACHEGHARQGCAGSCSCCCGRLGGKVSAAGQAGGITTAAVAALAAWQT
jgi:hypothetical protein